MSATPEEIEQGAFAIYCRFIRDGVGTAWQKRDGQGRPLKDHSGKPILETPQETCARRWRMLPELTRQRFRDEAAACIEAIR